MTVRHIPNQREGAADDEPDAAATSVWIDYGLERQIGGTGVRYRRLNPKEQWQVSAWGSPLRKGEGLVVRRVTTAGFETVVEAGCGTFRQAVVTVLHPGGRVDLVRIDGPAA